MTDYRLTELPWQADPLPGLFAIRELGHPVLLDSAASGDRQGRFSIAAADPVQLITARQDESGLQTIDRLRTAISQLGPAGWPEELQLPFGAGALGFISYDFGRNLENLPEQALADISLPSLQMGIYRWSLISDNRRQRRWLVCHPSVDADYQHKLLARLQAAAPQPGHFALQQPFSAEQSRAAYLAS